MKTAFLTGIRQLEVRDTVRPAPPKGRGSTAGIEAVGVCGSDVTITPPAASGRRRLDFRRRSAMNAPV